MEIQKTAVTPNIASNTNQPPKDFSRLAAGAILNAVVIEKLDAGFYILKLSDGNLVRAHTDNELQPGQALRLEVVKSGVVPELKIVQPAQTGATTPLTLQNALRQLLPKQISLTEFTTALRQAAALTAESATPVGAAIQQALDLLPSKEDLMTAAGVERAAANSGAFLETKLAQQPLPQGDIKGKLLVLADTLQKALLDSASPGYAHALPQDAGKLSDIYHSLLAKTEGAIAHIALDQLASLPQNNEPQTAWHISIPFTNGAQSDTVKLKIKREDNPDVAQPKPSWSVVLGLNPPGMGLLNCKICLTGETVNTYFWGDHEVGMAQIQGNLDALAKRYTEAGLHVGHLNAVNATNMAQEQPMNGLAPTLLDDFA